MKKTQMMPFEANCKRDFYPAVHDSGKRKVTDIKWIFLHDEEALTARSSASYFKSKKSGGSAHLCIDDKECYRCLDNDVIPWAAAGHNESMTLDANKHGLHIEQAGLARWSTVIWKKHLKTLQRAAFKTAQNIVALEKHGNKIPVRFVNYKGLREGRKGISTHAEVTKAWPVVAARFGSHKDPGPFWPRALFMMYVRKYYKAFQV